MGRKDNHSLFYLNPHLWICITMYTLCHITCYVERALWRGGRERGGEGYTCEYNSIQGGYILVNVQLYTRSYYCEYTTVQQETIHVSVTIV